MSKRFPPESPDPSDLRRVREALAEVGYDEQGIAAALRIPHPAEIAPGRRPLLQAVLDTEAEEPLRTLIDLFLLEGWTSFGELLASLDRDLVAALRRLRLVQVRSVEGSRGEDREVRAAVSLFPAGGALIATDHRSRPGAGGRGRIKEPVMYLGGDSYGLVYLQPPAPGEKVLDLCTGSGVQAIIAALSGAHDVVGVDLNPRALAFATFNAALNEVDDVCRFELGDLFEPLGSAARFDLILANPPFVPSPAKGRSRLAFRDGGARGDDVLGRLLHEASRRLTPEGRALVVTVVGVTEGTSARTRVRSMLPRSADVDSLLLTFGFETPEGYAYAQTASRQHSTEEQRRRLERWLRTLTGERIISIWGGVIVVAPHTGWTAPVDLAHDVLPPRAPAPGAVGRLLTALRVAGAGVLPAELLGLTARLSADARLIDESGPGTEAVRSTVLARGLPLAPLELSPTVRALLGALAQPRLVSDAVEAVAALGAAPLADVRRLMCLTLRTLIERGVLTVESRFDASSAAGLRSP
ncbi:MAG: methyltransferase [Planctomycetota bacterium]|jgi:SAM-dependent methyltransferase